MISNTLSIGDYHANDHVSHSMLRYFERYGARGYHARFIEKTRDESSSTAQRFGRLFEKALDCRLNGSSLAWLAANPFDGRTKKGKEWANEKAEGDYEVVTKDQLEAITFMLDSLVGFQGVLSEIKASFQPQVSIHGDHPSLPGLQSRPDFLDAEHGVSIDLKTTQCLSQFESSVWKYGYYSQAALLSRLFLDEFHRPLKCKLLVVEKEFPYRSQIVTLDDQYMEAGAQWVSDQIASLSYHYGTGDWSDSNKETTLSLPRWAEVREENGNDNGRRQIGA